MLGVTECAHDALMTIQMTCPWCEDEVPFEIDETRDEVVCSGCSTRLEFAPDPVTTYGLLYEPVAA